MDEMQRAIPLLVGRGQRPSPWRPVVQYAFAVAFWIWIVSGGLGRMAADGWDNLISFPMALTAWWIGRYVYMLLPGVKNRRWGKYIDRLNIIGKQFVYVIRTDGVYLNKTFSRHEYAWPEFIGLEETGEFFFLRSAGPGYHVFPKRAFKDNDEMNRFRTMVRAHIDDPSAARAFPVVPALTQDALAGPS